MNIIITIVVTIVALVIGLFFGAMPLQTNRMTEEQSRYSQVLSIVGIGMVIILMLVKMDVASWTVIAAMLFGLLIVKIPALHQWILKKMPWFSPAPPASPLTRGGKLHRTGKNPR